MVQRGGDNGQASVELVAAIPALLAALLLVAQFAIAGYTLWTAGLAAHAGARAAFVGGNGRRAARASLPPSLRRSASIRDRGAITVRVRAPSLIPGVPKVPVTARAGLGAGSG